MSQQQDDQNRAPGSRPSSPTGNLAGSLGTTSAPNQDTSELELDLIPSPPASATNPDYTNVDGSARVYRFPNSLPPRFGDSSSESNANANERVVTVRDLRTKSCWICSDEDEDPPASFGQPGSSASPSAASSRPKRFVHPCKCTLVAHETCLLRWIDQSRRNHPLNDQVTCPQCKAPYILVNDKTALLKTFEFFDKFLNLVEPVGAIALFGGGFLLACTTYGSVAIRMFLGKDAARRALASPWPWHYWVDIPLIPFALIASRFNIFESAMTWVPTLVAFPLTSLPLVTATAAHERLFERYLESSIFNARAYPPGPALTALIIPWVRVFYLAIKRKVYRTVLSPFYGGRRNADTSGNNNGGRRRRRRSSSSENQRAI